MASLTPNQRRVRRQFELAIGLAAPLLDLVLAAGEQVSRVAGRRDQPVPLARPTGDPRMLRGPSRTAVPRRSG